MKKLVLLIIISGAFFSIAEAQQYQAAPQTCRELKSKEWNYAKTSHGYIRFGPQNPSFAHIYTNAPRFIFNKDVYSYYGGFSSYRRNNLSFKINGKTKMTIKSYNGNVGIGTANPTEKLEVVGNALVQSDLKVYQNFEVDGQVKLSNVATSNDTSNLLLSIGPNGILSAIPFSAFPALLVEPKIPQPCTPNAEGNYFEAEWYNNGESPNPVIYTDYHCPVKVGIATSNPQADFHVNGDAKVGLGLEVGNANDSNSKLEVRSDAVFDKSIAIGTDIQNGFDLAVCGNIRAADVKVNAISDWCDYVFEEDYDLRSLKDVENYILEHKHLPEIPSAVEVETEGIAVSEMLLLMMKKIEELTLYTIEQDKRIQELENTK